MPSLTTSLRFSRTALAISALFALAACQDMPPAAGDDPAVSLRTEKVPESEPLLELQQTDGWLVVFKPNIDALDRSRALVAAQAAVSYTLQYVDGVVIRSGDVDALRANPIVEAVYLNTRFTTQQAYQTNALYWRRGVQWDMRQIEAHLATTRGTGVRVCVVDGPIAATHRDFAGKVIALAHFPGNASWAATTDFSSHGSHVASTVSTNGIGLASVAPGAVLLSANVFGPSQFTSVAQIIDGMMWCVQPAQSADVINLSLGGPRTRGSDAWKSDSTIYWVYTTVARTKGAVVVAAAGNDGVALPSASSGYVPAEVGGVIAVGATGPASSTAFPFAPQAPHPSFDLRPAYSNHNSGNEALGVGVRIYAPGGTRSDLSQLRILGVCSGLAIARNCSGADTYFANHGTSMAAPHVSGVVALITQRYVGRPRDLTRAANIEACLLQTADPLPAGAPFFGRGRVNARRATTESCPGL